LKIFKRELVLTVFQKIRGVVKIERKMIKKISEERKNPFFSKEAFNFL